MYFKVFGFITPPEQPKTAVNVEDKSRKLMKLNFILLAFDI